MMNIAGGRRDGRAIAVSVGAMLVTATLFEEGLNVVLPGGALNWNLRWLW